MIGKGRHLKIGGHSDASGVDRIDDSDQLGPLDAADQLCMNLAQMADADDRNAEPAVNYTG
jgi:hypothetical protein